MFVYLNRSGADPDEVRRVAEFVLGRKLTISEEGIKELARRIKEAVGKLTGIDSILEATQYDLMMIENLKREAIQAK